MTKDELETELRNADAVCSMTLVGCERELWEALRHGDAHAVERLLYKPNGDFFKESNDYALQAFISGILLSEDRLGVLAKAEFDINKEFLGRTNLLFAAMNRGLHQAVRRCLDNGFDVRGRDENGDTALLWAAARGDAKSFDVLMEHGSDPKMVGMAGTSLAARATLSASGRGVEILTSMEANWGLENMLRENVCSCLRLSLVSRDMAAAEFLADRSTAEELTEALRVAWGHVEEWEFAMMLMNKGADWNEMDFESLDSSDIESGVEFKKMFETWRLNGKLELELDEKAIGAMKAKI